MKSISLLTLLALVAPFAHASAALPPEAANIQLIPVRSAIVTVFQPAIRSNEGKLELSGSVYKRIGTRHDPATHLDVVFQDSARRTLRVETIQVPPRQTTGLGKYAVPLGTLPAETSVIVVRAHQGRHDKA